MDKTITATQTYPLSFETTVEELTNWLDTVDEQAKITVNAIPGDRNESTHYTLTARWTTKL